MKNRIAMFVLVTALVAPQTALWADFFGLGKKDSGSTASAPANPPKHKHKSHPHKKTKKEQKAQTPSGPPSGAPVIGNTN